MTSLAGGAGRSVFDACSYPIWVGCLCDKPRMSVRTHRPYDSSLMENSR
jgi:hypothetical protein